MKNLPLISVVIPVYNVEKYLINCIKSVVNQTYHNFEIILINDGSTDDSGKICDEYKEKDDRIRVIHKENGGLSSARNMGIEESKGEYITFIDSDDDIIEKYIEYLYNLIIENETKISIASYTIVSDKKKINIGNGFEEKILNTEECLDRMLCEKGFTVSACAKLYNKCLFDDIRFPEGRLNEDNGTIYKIILKCDKIAYGNKSIYNYYKRKNSIMTSKFSLNRLDLIELTDQMCDEIDIRYPNLKDSTIKKRITSRFSILRQMLVNKMSKEQKMIEKDIENYIKKRKQQILKNRKMGLRDKIALITLILGKRIFAISWIIYCKMFY